MVQPGDVVVIGQTGSLVNAARCLALDQAAVATMRVLEQAGIDVLLLKGPVTAARLYPGAPDGRDYCDVDLLVAPQDYLAAQAALARNGYVHSRLGVRPSELDEREVTWLVAGPTPLSIDLHRSLASVGKPDVLWNRLWRDRSSMQLQGSTLQVPDVAGTALIVALHASRPGKTRKPFRDLARAVAVIDDSQWQAAIETASACDALSGLTLGFDAVQQSRQLVGRFELATTAPTAMRLAAQSTSPAGQALARFIDQREVRAWPKYLIGRAIPSRAHMRQGWPVSRSGPWGLLRAHGQRWWRLGRTLPRGLVELARARRGGIAGRDTWTLDALGAVRTQLAETGMAQTQPFRAPGRGITARSVGLVLERHGASCLESSLVRQRFHCARGRQRDVIIGVRAANANFHAHAWLAGDTRATAGFEILHRVSPTHGSVRHRRIRR